MLSAYADEFSRQPWPGLFALCCAGTGGAALTHQHLHHNFALPWATMLLAMMPVLLAHPVSHIHRSSRPRRLMRALVAFTAGYAVMWMCAGPPLMAIAQSIVTAAGDGAASIVLTLLAFAWSATPWHQRALNRAHRPKSLAVFGWQADFDAIAYGLVHGAWCFASCWAWMLVPLVVRDHHVAAMILVTLIMFVERLAPAARPKWRVPFPVRLIRSGYAHV